MNRFCSFVMKQLIYCDYERVLCSHTVVMMACDTRGLIILYVACLLITLMNLFMLTLISGSEHEK